MRPRHAATVRLDIDAIGSPVASSVTAARAASLRRPAVLSAWRLCIDTALDTPHDICPWPDATVVTQTEYVVQPRSVVLLALALDDSVSTTSS